jgi:creatinine amidohydrolase
MALIKWAELREEEFEDAVKKSDGLCLVPVGCFEMHGQHLPVRTDVYQAEAIAEAAAKLETAVVFPAFEFGAVSSLVEWRGAVRLDPHLMLDLLENYCTEIARNGFDKIMLVNYHGGNTGFLGYFSSMLGHKHRDFSVITVFPHAHIHDEMLPNVEKHGLSYYPDLTEEDLDVMRDYVYNQHVGGHGCMLETCVMLYIHPELVRMDRLGTVSGLPTHKGDRFVEAGVVVPGWCLNFPNSYCATDPVRATARLGKVMLDILAEKVAKAARVFKEDNKYLVEQREKKRPHYPNN